MSAITEKFARAGNSLFLGQDHRFLRPSTASARHLRIPASGGESTIQMLRLPSDLRLDGIRNSLSPPAALHASGACSPHMPCYFLCAIPKNILEV
jgi:hypothetical protein